MTRSSLGGALCGERVRVSWRAQVERGQRWPVRWMGAGRAARAWAATCVMVACALTGPGQARAQNANPLMSSSSTSSPNGSATSPAGTGFEPLTQLTTSSSVSTKEGPLTTTEVTTLIFVDLMTMSAKGAGLALVLGLGVALLTGSTVVTIVLTVSMGEQGAMDLYLREHAHAMMADVHLGAGGSLDDLARFLGVEPTHHRRFVQQLRAHRASLTPPLEAALRGEASASAFLKAVVVVMLSDPELSQGLLRSPRVQVRFGPASG